MKIKLIGDHNLNIYSLQFADPDDFVRLARILGWEDHPEGGLITVKREAIKWLDKMDGEEFSL